MARGSTPSRWHFFNWFRIPDYDDPDKWYLERLRIVTTPWFGIFLHKINTPDSRPTLHDHPWTFVSIPIIGGYVEKRLNKHTRQIETKHRRWLNVMRRDDAHYIESLDRTPTWSLLFVGQRRRLWGYWRLIDTETNKWTWTPFNTDHHATEFDRAIQRRRNA